MLAQLLWSSLSGILSQIESLLSIINHCSNITFMINCDLHVLPGIIHYDQTLSWTVVKKHEIPLHVLRSALSHQAIFVSINTSNGQMVYNKCRVSTINHHYSSMITNHIINHQKSSWTIINPSFVPTSYIVNHGLAIINAPFPSHMINPSTSTRPRSHDQDGGLTGAAAMWSYLPSGARKPSLWVGVQLPWIADGGTRLVNSLMKLWLIFVG